MLKHIKIYVGANFFILTDYNTFPFTYRLLYRKVKKKATTTNSHSFIHGQIIINIFKGERTNWNKLETESDPLNENENYLIPSMLTF